MHSKNYLKKKEIVEDFKKELNDCEAVILVHYHGLTVSNMTDLRKRLRSNGASLKVFKNNLSKFVFHDTKFQDISCKLKGPIAVAYSKDPVVSAKCLVEFAKEKDALTLIAASVSGQVLDVSGIKVLSELPSLDELRAKILGVISAPASKVVSVLSSPARSLVGVIDAYAKK